MKRAYAILTVKAVQEDQRIITGIATTPSPDRVGDIIEPLGVKFTNPMPLLHQHRSDEPVGKVTFGKPTKAGIPFEARIPTYEIPGSLKDRIDTAWGEVKLGLVPAVSIGFRPIEYSIMDDGGYRFIECEVLELSLVTIPANQDAVISTVKSIDAPLRAASGRKQLDDDTPLPAPRDKPTKIVKAQEAKMTKRTIVDQIAGFEASRHAKAARMQEIMDVAADKGETLDEAGQQEYDGLSSDLKSVDAHLVRLREMETLSITKAVEVKGADADDASRWGGQAGSSGVQIMPKKIEKGIGFTRYVLAMARAKGNIMHALEIAKANEQWRVESPEVAEIIKAGVAAGGTGSWGSSLVNYQILTSEFIEYLRPLTIIGRLQGLTYVPFNVKIQRQTGGSTVNWVGQGAPKPVTSGAFDTVTLDLAKIAGIIVLNDELIKISSPAAETLMRNDLAKAIIQFMDAQFVDPTVAAVTGVSPASITNGVSAQLPSGTTGAALRSDLKTLLSTFLTASMQVTGVNVIMSQRLALAIGLMTNSLGQKEFPDLDMNGGKLLGLPVVTSENVPSTGGSPSDGDPIIVVSAPDVLIADDGDVQIDASREASLQMDTAPDSPPTSSTVLYSLFQNNGVAIRAERYVNWVKRRSTAAAYISNAKYFE